MGNRMWAFESNLEGLLVVTKVRVPLRDNGF